MRIRFVSERCHMTPETPVKHRRLREHVDGHRCCGKSLIRSALVRLTVLQHARTESISKRAPSTTRTSPSRVNNLQTQTDDDQADCDTSSNVPRSFRGSTSTVAATEARNQPARLASTSSSHHPGQFGGFALNWSIHRRVPLKSIVPTNARRPPRPETTQIPVTTANSLRKTE